MKQNCKSETETDLIELRKLLYNTKIFALDYLENDRYDDAHDVLTAALRIMDSIKLLSDRLERIKGDC